MAKKRKGADINQNKPTTSMRELAREKIRKQMQQQMEGPRVKNSKLKKDKDGKASLKTVPLKDKKAKGKDYKSSMDRNIVEKDPNSKKLLTQKYVKDTKPGGRSNTG